MQEKKNQENAAVNVGHTVKWFSDIDAARAWLKGPLEAMKRE
jgi:hypothetical protein